MADESEDLEAILERVPPSDREQLFVLKVPRCVSPSQMETFQRTWERARGNQFGRLLVITDECELTALTGAELERLGLAKIAA